MTVTDAEGRFEFAQLPGGAFTLSASKTGYVNLQYGQRRPYEPGRPISLASGQALDRIDISLPRGSVIAARITDDLGFPLSGVDVSAQRFQYRSDGRRALTSFYAVSGPTTTNDRGEIRLFGLMPGEYIVQASARSAIPPSRNADGSAEGYTATFYPGVITASQAAPVTLGIGEEKSVQFSMARVPLARVSGVVVDSSGRPVRDARLTLSGHTETLFIGNNATSSTTGTFTIENVPPGDYTVSVSAIADDGFATLSVTGADLSDVRIVVGPGTTIYGRLAFEGAARPTGGSPNFLVATSTIDSLPPGAARRRSGPVDATGRFGFTGSYGRVLFDVTTPDGWMLQSVLVNGADVTHRSFDLGNRAELTDVAVTVTNRVTSLSGQVADDRGQSARDYVVVLVPVEAYEPGVMALRVKALRPGPDGTFTVRKVIPDRYAVVAVDALEVGREFSPEFQLEVRRRGQDLTLRAGENRTLSLRITPDF